MPKSRKKIQPKKSPKISARPLGNKENPKKALKMELKKGEESGFVEQFDRHQYMKKLYAKHIK